MRERRLDTLDPRFKPYAINLLARLVEAGIAVLIVETLRTEDQHLEDVATGHSWIKRSLHQDGLAIDIVPYTTYQLNGDDKLNWDSDDPVWQKIGAIGESLGLGWGGRWKNKDMGHFEYISIKNGVKTGAPTGTLDV